MGGTPPNKRTLGSNPTKLDCHWLRKAEAKGESHCRTAVAPPRRDRCSSGGSAHTGQGLR